jgi:hypothetical protein
MNKIAALLFVLLFSAACGKPGDENQTLTPEQETLLADSISNDLTQFTRDLDQKADSITADVDSLLEGI